MGFASFQTSPLLGTDAILLQEAAHSIIHSQGPFTNQTKTSSVMKTSLQSTRLLYHPESAKSTNSVAVNAVKQISCGIAQQR
jgi:hypothetical protein